MVLYFKVNSNEIGLKNKSVHCCSCTGHLLHMGTGRPLCMREIGKVGFIW